MNYIIKRVLKKILTQYLFIRDDGLDLSSGILKLPSGNINHSRINQKLKPFNLQITESSYNNLIVHIPIIELLSKPIKISIETLDIVIEKLPSSEMERKQSQSEIQLDHIKKISKSQQEEKQVATEEEEEKQNSGYFKNIINRLLYNMEIFMEKINVRMIDQKEDQEFREAFFTINSMNIKNSLVILEANIIKKTLNLQLFHIKHSFGEVQIKDLNICFDFNNKKISLIAILGSLQIDLYKLPFAKITKKLTKRIKKPPKDLSKQKLTDLPENLDLNIFFKINRTDFNSKLVKINFSALQSTIKKSSFTEDITLNFQKISLKKSINNEQDESLLEILYLPLSSEVKIYSQYEDNIIKNCFFNLKREKSQGISQISGKVYHLKVRINLNECKILLDSLLKYERQIVKLGKIVKRYIKNGPNVKQKYKQIQEPTQKINITVLLYRFLFQVVYENLQLSSFGSATFNSLYSDQVPQINSSSKSRKRYSKKSQQNEPLQVQKIQKQLLKLKILQFGTSIANYNVCEISQFQCEYDLDQIIVTGCSLSIEASLKLIDRIRDSAILAKRDSIYYAQKLKKVLLFQEEQIILSEQSKQSEENLREMEDQTEKIPKIYMKFNQIEIRLGQLCTKLVQQPAESKKQKPKYRQSSTFIPILEVELVNTLFSFVASKSKLRSDMITYLYSPYTLQKNPITNEVQLSFTHNLKTKESNITLSNNLVVLIDDQYVNILYKLFDKDSIWCFFRNLTHEDITFIQETSNFEPLLSNQHQEYMTESQSEVHYHSIKIDRFKNHELFWLNDQDFKLLIGKRKSQYILLNKSEDLKLNNSTQIYQSTLQISFQDGRESNFLLRFLYNKLGNLLQVVLDYRTHIVSYSKEFVIHIKDNSYPILVDRECAINPTHRIAVSGHWYHLLEDCLEDPLEISLAADGTTYVLQSLVSNEQFTIYGISLKDCQARSKRYHSYILQTIINKAMHFTIMPFLIIHNNLDFDIEIEIVDKKSQQKETFLMKKSEKKELNCNQGFDYYMKQFIIKLCLFTGRGNYESQQFYFNTFTMIDQVTETSIQLRSTAKQDYTKKVVNFSEGLLLKSKVITLKNSSRVVNKSDFSFCLRIKSDDKERRVIDEMMIGGKETEEWCCKLKKETLIQVIMVNSIENKIQFSYGQIRNQKVLSFNFCKIQDKFYNLLIKIESRLLDGMQTIQLQNFLQIVNLCHYIKSFRIEQQNTLNYQQKSFLPLNSTSLNKYNNKLVDLDDMNKIYAEIFLTTKVTDQPLKIHIDDSFITFSDIVKHNCLEVILGSNRYVLTLLKDMNYNRMTFYLTDRLYNQKMNYTIFNNQTAQHFLFSDDSEYSHHFIVQQEDKPRLQSPPAEKIFIEKQSFNCMINKENNDVLLCDKDQKHLEKVEKKTLDKFGIRMQQHQFQSIMLFDCQDEEEDRAVKRQLSTKGVEIRLKMLKKIELTMSIKALTIRLLENGKLDCLIQDISVRNEETKDHLLRIPEETYLLLEGKVLDQNHFFLIKNVFLKCKNIIINIKRQMPYSIINLAMNLSERMGLKVPQEMEVLEPRKYRQKIKKFDGELRLKRYINQKLFLIKNIFLHEIHLSLTIELENLSFSNVIILPQYEVSNKFIREKSLKSELVTFYLTNLLAKFPKLSFLMTNFKSPLNTIKLFFNIRDAMKQKFHPHPIIFFSHTQLPENPFLFSLQRWNNITNNLSKALQTWPPTTQKLFSFIYQNKKYLILTNRHILWLQQDEYQEILLTDLQHVKIIKNRANSEIIMRFKNGDKLMLIEDHKKCIKFVNKVQQLLL